MPITATNVTGAKVTLAPWDVPTHLASTHGYTYGVGVNVWTETDTWD